jgi:hypothetical protein
MTCDRLALIRSRHAEAGGGDADKAWLIAEVERLDGAIRQHLQPHIEHKEDGTTWSWACADADLAAAVYPPEARDRAEAEVDRLRARVAELEAFAEPILSEYEPGSNTAQNFPPRGPAGA